MQHSEQIRKELIKIESDYLLSTGWVKKTDVDTKEIQWLGSHNPLWKSRDMAIQEQKLIEFNSDIKNNKESDWKLY